MELENKVVIITGASMGIGAATAREFVKAGAKVVLAARSEKELNVLAQELGAERAFAVPTDVTVRAQVKALMQKAVERFGRIDILVNNAGVGMAGPVATLDTSHLERILSSNVLGPVYGIQSAVPHMRQSGGGIIMNVSSMVSKLVIPTIGGYRATKMALNAITDNARFELARDNIRVIAVYPGETQTKFFDNTLDGGGRAAVTGRARRMDPPEHVARKIVQGARQEPREVYMSGGNRVFGLIGTLIPTLFERMMRGRASR
jgi:NADP-dependent 3-hydroxy acid dehydrogenase YdfG